MSSEADDWAGGWYLVELMKVDRDTGRKCWDFAVSVGPISPHSLEYQDNRSLLLSVRFLEFAAAQLLAIGSVSQNHLAWVSAKIPIEITAVLVDCFADWLWLVGRWEAEIQGMPWTASLWLSLDWVGPQGRPLRHVGLSIPVLLRVRHFCSSTD